MIKSIETAFCTASISNNTLFFPQQMYPKIYDKVKSMLTNIRGKYVGKGDSAHFEFPFNPTAIIDTFIATGNWPKKNPFAFFPTPINVIDYALEFTFAGANEWTGYDLVRVFEPSAGSGNFIDAVAADFAKHNIPVEIVCAELDPVNIAILKSKGYTVIEGDFLNVEVDSLDKFDLIVTNPPFQKNTYINHVNHAQCFLKENGRMMAVIPTTLFTNTTKKGKQLKQIVCALNIGEFNDCIFESGTFKDTEVETMIVVINSVEKTASDLANLESYAAHLMCMCLNNEQGTNTAINKCTSVADVKELMPRLMDEYISIAPYAFVNPAIIKQAQKNFVNSLELNDVSAIVKVPPTKVKVTASIDYTLTQIYATVTDIPTKLKPTKSKEIKSKPKATPRDSINKDQLDMFAFS